MLKLNDDIELLTIEGRRFWRFASGELLPVVSGGDGPDDDPDDDPDNDPDDDKGKGGDKTLTQAQVDRIVAREKAKHERETKRRYDEYLASQKADADKATMDEAERAKADADEAKAEAERVREEAKRERLNAKIERKLGAAGIDDKAIERASRLINLESDASDDDIAAEIDSLKNDMPGLFAKSDEDDDTGTGKGAPSGVTTGAGAGKNSGKGGVSAMERGKQLYAEKAKKSTTTNAA